MTMLVTNQAGEDLTIMAALRIRPTIGWWRRLRPDHQPTGAPKHLPWSPYTDTDLMCLAEDLACARDLVWGLWVLAEEAARSGLGPGSLRRAYGLLKELV